MLTRDESVNCRYRGPATEPQRKRWTPMTDLVLQFARKSPLFITAAVVAVSLGAVILHQQTRTVQVSRVTVALPDLPPALDGLTILHLSDLHNTWFGREHQDLLGGVAGHRVDLIALTGDLIDKWGADPAPTLALVRGLRRTFPDRAILSVPGNHDWWSGKYPSLRERLLAEGILVLENGHATLSAGAGTVRVIGADDPFTGRADLGSAIRGAGGEGPRILLAHAPNILPEAAAAGVDLVLVGHTHGGQIRLPGLGALWVPGQGLFPKYSAGLYREGKTQMYVNRGLGVSGAPFRFLSPPEAALITLTGVSSESEGQ